MNIYSSAWQLLLRLKYNFFPRLLSGESFRNKNEMISLVTTVRISKGCRLIFRNTFRAQFI